MELYHSVRALLSSDFFIKEVLENTGTDIEKLKFVSSSTVYVDNNGSMVVAKIPRMTPTSDNIDVKNIGRILITLLFLHYLLDIMRPTYCPPW